MLTRRRAARVLSLLASRHADVTASDGVVAHRTVLAYAPGDPVVAWGVPATTEHRVRHLARYAAALETVDDLPVIAVRALCGATIVGPRTGYEVAVLTAPDAVLDCLRCLARCPSHPYTREAVRA